MKTSYLILFKSLVLGAFLSVFSFGTAAADSNVLPDTENCLYCHRYPSMGRYDESGTKRIFYVNDEKFARSVHGKLKCKSCHVGLDKIPHTDIMKVDCTTKCHIREPSTDKEFSHINMAQKYEASVHGSGTKENPKPFSDDLPTCKDCHENRIQSPVDGLWGKSEALSNETLTRCIGCHTQKDWAQNFYLHFTHRMRRIRSQPEIIKLCTSCHEDSRKMARHGLESVSTFKDTFHWSLVKYGVKNAPDCLSCHVPVGYSTHDIRPRTDPMSSIHTLNRVDTCSNQGGMQSCHPGATAEFATGRVHAYGAKVHLAAGEEVPDFEDHENFRLLERAEKDISNEEIFHHKILSLIQLFYKIFIPLVIGFMAYHQWLDWLKIIRTRKKRR